MLMNLYFDVVVFNCKRDDGAEGRKLRHHCKVKTSYFIRSVNRLLLTNLINPKDRITARGVCHEDSVLN